MTCPRIRRPGSEASVYEIHTVIHGVCVCVCVCVWKEEMRGWWLTTIRKTVVVTNSKLRKRMPIRVPSTTTTTMVTKISQPAAARVSVTRFPVNVSASLSVTADAMRAQNADTWVYEHHFKLSIWGSHKLRGTKPYGVKMNRVKTHNSSDEMYLAMDLVHSFIPRPPQYLSLAVQNPHRRTLKAT